MSMSNWVDLKLRIVSYIFNIVNYKTESSYQLGVENDLALVLFGPLFVWVPVVACSQSGTGMQTLERIKRFFAERHQKHIIVTN